MSYQVLLDFPGATARSKGQARRRNQPSLSDDARRDQRNLARRERARCKRIGRTKQPHVEAEGGIPYMTIAPANLARSSVPPSSNSNRLEHDAYVTAEDKAAFKISQPALPPHPPTITALPAHPIDINRRALAQSNRYIAAQSKVQETNDSMRIDVQRLGDVTGDVSVIPARDPLESQSTPERHDFDAAEILLAVAQEPRAISTTPELGDMLAATVDGPEEDAISISSWTCPVSTCIDHRKRFSSKTERDIHTRTHFEGMGCGHSQCCASTFLFKEFKRMFAHTKLAHPISIYDTGKPFKCQSCTQEFKQSDYLDHFDDCMVRTVKRKALGNAAPCPVSWCYYHLKDFDSTYLRGQHLFQCHSSTRTRHDAVSGCKRCSETFETDNQLTRHVLENHNNVPLKCLCCSFWFSIERFLEHFAYCHIFLRESRMPYLTSF